MDHHSNAKNSRIAVIPTKAKKLTFPQLKLSPAFLSSDSHYDVTGFFPAPTAVSSCCTYQAIFMMKKQLDQAK